MRVGIGQIRSVVGDFAGNTRAILARIDEARSQDCDLVVFPEAAVCGPFPLDLVRRPGFVDACEAAIETIRAATGGLVVIVGTIGRDRTDASLRNRAVIIENGTIRSQVDKTAVSPLGPGEEARYFTPSAGVLAVEVAGDRLGVLLGDANAGDGDADVLAGLGATWTFRIAASPFHVGVGAERRATSVRIAIEDGIGTVYVNGVGARDGVVLDGGSHVIDPQGRLIAQAPAFEEGLTVVDLEDASPIDPPVEDPLEECRLAITMGIRDYVAQSGFERVVLGLSGGIDSALVACLATEALGPTAVTCVHLPCAASSAESLADARAVASALGCELLEMDVREVHAALRSALPFEALGIVDENLQARARAVLWMAIANDREALVMAAGNKSEIAVGYATLYGDTTGSLAPIADLYKTDVYRLARRFEEAIPPSIFDKAPSAELRPDQRDDDDLPPYDVLDPLLAALIEENASRDDLIARGNAEDVVDDVLRRFYAAEFKRRQLPAAVVVSAHPLSARRVPLSNAFRK